MGQRSKLTEGVERLLQNSPRVNTFPVPNKPDGWGPVCARQNAACLRENRRWRLAVQKQQKAAPKKNRDKQRLPDLDNDN